MPRRTRCRRAFALTWAVLQFALPALGALAEAALAEPSASAVALGHVEDRSGPGCRPIHAPDCARCQSLSTHAVALPAPAVDWGLLAVAACPVLDDRGPRHAARTALPLSRAPPPHS